MKVSLKSREGLRSASRTVRLSEAEMRAFGKCVRATVGNTVHSGIDSGAIPSVFTVFRGGEFELVAELGIDLAQVLHAEQAYEIQGVFHPDEEIEYASVLASVTEKRKGAAGMAFLAFETEFRRAADGATLAFSRSTMVYREPGAAGGVP